MPEINQRDLLFVIVDNAERKSEEKKPVRISDTESYRSVVRCICALPSFDRLGIALITKQPYGTVSRILSELSGEGYLERTGERQEYFRDEVMKNPEFYYEGIKKVQKGKGRPRMKRKLIWPYGVQGVGQYKVANCAQLRKTKKWDEFLVRWQCILNG